MIVLDGGFGTMVQAAGLPAGKDPTDWNLENPDAVAGVHRAYVEAGATIVLSNTFGANRLKYHGAYEIGDLVAAAISIARRSGAKVALDIGPTGKLLEPIGDLGFDEAYEAFAELVRYGTAAGADLVFIETMGNLKEVKAAVLAAKENSHLPVFVSIALGEDGKILSGGDVESFSALVEALGVDAYGLNCGLGPDRMLQFVERLSRVSSKPIIAKPNAGMPKLVDGKTVFVVDPKEFAEHVSGLVGAGASIIGGCCGTTPDHIRGLSAIHENGLAKAPTPRTVVSSGMSSVVLRPHQGLIIGERINPTGKKALKEAYLKGDTSYVLREAVVQTEAGAAILDVNCGVPGIDEAATLEATVRAVQSVVTCPLQIDTADPEALERSLRHVDGKALVNSVNGKQESMDSVFPLVRKYGGVIVALCLDESGIPNSSDGRIEIAKRILAEGAKYGFKKEDFVFDALTLAVSADPMAAVVTLETVRRLTDELGVNTVLGVSNVSFGLPNRPALNNAMYTLAVKNGLSAAIANPLLIREVEDEAAFDVLLGRDANCSRWIALCAENAGRSGAAPLVAAGSGEAPDLHRAIVRGLRADAGRAVEFAFSSGRNPMDVIQEGIVPALEEVGRGFEAGTLFLPQLLMAADAAGDAFAVVRKHLGAEGGKAMREGARPIVVATVKGDIHDIGKNIVRALLENYGFDVIDLGRDVAPERIVETAIKANAMMVGLSALMTTTVGAMAETVRQLKASFPECKTCVGGAVVTQEYADSIGADFYAGDAMRTVRYAESLESRLA